MKVAIISDTHDKIDALKKLFEFTKKQGIEILIHCGDVCRGETLKEISKNFKKVYLCWGNGEILESFEESLENVEIFENVGSLEIEGLKICFSHFPNIAKKEFEKGIFDFVFFGHTHFPSLKEENGKYLANPGSLSFFNPTFAILDTKEKKLELKFLKEINNSP